MTKYRVVKPFVCQDTKRRFEPGEIYVPLSDFERSRNTAEKNIVPVDDNRIEMAVETVPEVRKRRTRRKKIDGLETHNSSNG